MGRFLLYIFTGLITSLFLFPFNLPITGIGINTKMILAVIGAGFFVIDKIAGKESSVSRDFLLLSLLCTFISIWSFWVTTWNHTSDFAFAKYLLSVWVWLGAAYAVIWFIRTVHQTVTVELVGNYLIAVCTFQCVLAYAMSVWPSFGILIDGLMGEGETFMGAVENRMHGLGAALDPAGLRFSAILLILAFFTTHTDFDVFPWKGLLYLTAFIIISVIGNMIARSTTIGMICAITLFVLLKRPKKGKLSIDRSWIIIGGGFLFVSVLSIWLYRKDPVFRSNLRFGFEGFFSLFERGRWEVRSNEILKGMIVWPETLKTWLIGDGFFDSPQDMPNSFGQVFGGFYKHTDIGYLRYVFYFGAIGLLGMITVFVKMTATCVRWLKGYKWMFLSLLLVNLIGWFKVSSDIIMVFAPFLILAYLQSENPSLAIQECKSSRL